jgi:hypothetical protein
MFWRGLCDLYTTRCVAYIPTKNTFHSKVFENPVALKTVREPNELLDL